MPETGRDLKMTDDGDFVIGDDGDLELATAARSTTQDVQFRVLNNYGDFAADPLLATDLKRFKGSPNTRQTGEAIKDAVYYALTRDGRFSNSSVFVDVVPYAQKNGPKRGVVIFVFVMDYVEDLENQYDRNPYDANNLVVSFVYDLDIGEITRITGNKE